MAIGSALLPQALVDWKAPSWKADVKATVSESNSTSLMPRIPSAAEIRHQCIKHAQRKDSAIGIHIKGFLVDVHHAFELQLLGFQSREP